VSEPIGHRPINWAIVLGLAIPALALGGSVVGLYIELAAQQRATLVVNGNQDASISELKVSQEKLRDEAVDREILQRLAVVETKIDGIAADKKKR